MCTVTNTIPRPEHPHPQFRRDNWLNLNGGWEFAFDHSRSGESRGMYKVDAEYPLTITVPFCPESDLSGIGYKDFIRGVWYRRTVTLTDAQMRGQVRLHFGAVDYECTVYVNEKKAGTHKGGYTSFSLDVTDLLAAGKNTIVVNAVDDTTNPMIPSGKQSDKFGSYGCLYTRTTGIWQTVWMEFMPRICIQRVKLTPSVDDTSVVVEAALQGDADLTVEAAYEGRPMGSRTVKGHNGILMLTLPLAEAHLWQPGEGRLYDLTFTYGEDTVHSYCGLREMHFDGYKWMLNGKSVFQRLVLDQGFYPDGIYTAPTDDALVQDILLSMAMGFNGARLHEKVFEQRFLYHCDRLGYMVWGEYPNWGLHHNLSESVFGILPEWLEEVQRDYNHPSIIGWCPFNETWDVNGHQQCDDVLRMVYRATKQMDPTRPCIDTSGNFHVETDVYDVHDYMQDVKTFEERYGKHIEVGTLFEGVPRQKWAGEPLMVSEFGGTGWNLESVAKKKPEDSGDGSSWSYGSAPKAPEEFIARFKGLVDVLLDNPKMFGFCYTQLTDVEQEQNGLYTYDRIAKFDSEVISAILRRKAAIED